MDNSDKQLRQQLYDKVIKASDHINHIRIFGRKKDESDNGKIKVFVDINNES